MKKQLQHMKTLVQDKVQDIHHSSRTLGTNVFSSLKGNKSKGVGIKLFGAPLITSQQETGREICVVIESCVSFLVENVKEEGIFRVPGSTSEVKRLKSGFDTGIYELKDRVTDPHAVAGTLKLFLRELPDPLMPHAFHARFTEAAKASDLNGRMILLKAVIKDLPQDNYLNLRYLMKFLEKLAQHSDFNKMTSQNIAMSLAQSLIWSPPVSGSGESSLYAQLDMTETSYHNLIVYTLVDHCSFFFPEEVVLTDLETFTSRERSMGQPSNKLPAAVNGSPNPVIEPDTTTSGTNSYPAIPPRPDPVKIPRKPKKPAPPVPPLLAANGIPGRSPVVTTRTGDQSFSTSQSIQSSSPPSTHNSVPSGQEHHNTNMNNNNNNNDQKMQDNHKVGLSSKGHLLKARYPTLSKYSNSSLESSTETIDSLGSGRSGESSNKGYDSASLDRGVLTRKNGMLRSHDRNSGGTSNQLKRRSIINRPSVPPPQVPEGMRKRNSVDDLLGNKGSHGSLGRNTYHSDMESDASGGKQQSCLESYQCHEQQQQQHHNHEGTSLSASQSPLIPAGCHNTPVSALKGTRTEREDVTSPTWKGNRMVDDSVDRRHLNRSRFPTSSPVPPSSSTPTPCSFSTFRPPPPSTSTPVTGSIVGSSAKSSKGDVTLVLDKDQHHHPGEDVSAIRSPASISSSSHRQGDEERGVTSSSSCFSSSSSPSPMVPRKLGSRSELVISPTDPLCSSSLDSSSILLEGNIDINPSVACSPPSQSPLMRDSPDADAAAPDSGCDTHSPPIPITTTEPPKKPPRREKGKGKHYNSQTGSLQQSPVNSTDDLANEQIHLSPPISHTSIPSPSSSSSLSNVGGGIASSHDNNCNIIVNQDKGIECAEPMNDLSHYGFIQSLDRDDSFTKEVHSMSSSSELLDVPLSTSMVNDVFEQQDVVVVGHDPSHQNGTPCNPDESLKADHILSHSILSSASSPSSSASTSYPDEGNVKAEEESHSFDAGEDIVGEKGDNNQRLSPNQDEDEPSIVIYSEQPSPSESLPDDTVSGSGIKREANGVTTFNKEIQLNQQQLEFNQIPVDLISKMQAPDPPLNCKLQQMDGSTKSMTTTEKADGCTDQASAVKMKPALPPKPRPRTHIRKPPPPPTSAP